MKNARLGFEQYWVWLGLMALLCVMFVLHPDLFLLRKSPMSGDPWTIRDPTVSWMAFMPSLREFRYELFEHGNFLWSNLRGLGQPMLGNGVQAAPLFPLTLLLIGLPDALFWSVMPITRVALIALACFVLARRVFGLPFAASFAFALIAGLNMNVFRWINHPWSNGILAGLWYLVFLSEVSFQRMQSLWAQRGARLGLIISVYAMITCGFPEAAAAAALLVVFIFGGLLVANVAAPDFHWRTMVRDLAICHLAGFCFSALQIFALIEYINFTGVLSLRDDYISGTYRPEQVTSYWLSQFTLLWESGLQHRYLNFSIGLLGLVLAIKGVLYWLICFRKMTMVVRAAGIGFVLLMLLFVAKSFGLSETLAWLFARIPVLAQSHYPLYFSIHFYFGLAFFASLGVYSFNSDSYDRFWQRGLDVVVTFIAMVGSISLLELSVEHFNNISRQNFWIMQERGDGAAFIWVFISISALLLLWLIANLSPGVQRVVESRSSLFFGLVTSLLIAGLIVEAAGTQRNRYANTDSESLFAPEQAKIALEKSLQDLPLNRHELRTDDYAGSFVDLGIATIDNGISAMLPPNTQRTRRALYYTQYGGYYPLGVERYKGSGSLFSNNLQITAPQPPVMDWSNFLPSTDQPSTQSNLRFLDWDPAIQLQRDNPWVLEGVFETPNKIADTTVSIQLKGSTHSLWVAADLTLSHSDSAISTVKWTARIPSHWLSETHYQFLVRAADPKARTFQDSNWQALTVQNPYPYAQTFRSAVPEQQTNSSTTQNWQVEFNPNTLPRAFVASGCELLQNEEAGFEFLRRSETAPRGHIALLESKLMGLNSDFCNSYSAGFSAVRILNDAGSHLAFAPVQGPALLYLADTYYPGWQVTDNTEKSDLNILPANLGMRAVYLPEDREYQIEFNYQPAWLVWVYILFLLACIATFISLKLVRAGPRRTEHGLTSS